MARFLTPLFLFLAHATHRQLIQQIQFLKVENQIIRSKLPARIQITPAERARLLKYGKPLGAVLKELITLVSPRTFCRWVAQARQRRPQRRRGRPQTPADLRNLILRMARENTWGYTRILGELKKLGIKSVGRTTLQNLLTNRGMDTGPHREGSTWNQFVLRHAQTLWACDFFTTRAWTVRGPRDYYTLFFIHVGSRKVWVSPATAFPGGQWVAQQARNFVMELMDSGQEITHLIRDRDGKYTDAFDAVLTAQEAKVCKLPPRSPHMNVYAERWCQTVKAECLDHFIVFGRRHLEYLVSQFVDHYHRHRPHQGKGNLTLEPLPFPLQLPAAGGYSGGRSGGGRVLCQQRLGGLLKHYYRKAA